MALDPLVVKGELRDFICRELLHNPDYPLQDDDSLINGGFLSSLAVIDLIVFIDERFGVFIPNEAMDGDRMDSLDKMTAYVLEWENREEA